MSRDKQLDELARKLKKSDNPYKIEKILIKIGARVEELWRDNKVNDEIHAEIALITNPDLLIHKCDDDIIVTKDNVISLLNHGKRKVDEERIVMKTKKRSFSIFSSTDNQINQYIIIPTDESADTHRDKIARTEPELEDSLSNSQSLDPDTLVIGIFKLDTFVCPIRAKENTKAYKLENEPVLYDEDSLPQLLKKIDCDDLIYPDEKIIRFLLNTESKLIFGLDGPPCGEIPAHFQMAHPEMMKARCITAGNAHFNDKNQLCRITHKSGDFRPPFETLQHMLPHLAKGKIPLAEEIIFVKLNHKGAPIEFCPVESRRIMEEFGYVNQNQDIEATENADMTSSVVFKF